MQSLNNLGLKLISYFSYININFITVRLPWRVWNVLEICILHVREYLPTSQGGTLNIFNFVLFLFLRSAVGRALAISLKCSESGRTVAILIENRALGACMKCNMQLQRQGIPIALVN